MRTREHLACSGVTGLSGRVVVPLAGVWTGPGGDQKRLSVAGQGEPRLRTVQGVVGARESLGKAVATRSLPLRRV